MGHAARTHWLARVLRALTAPVIGLLDEWSYRVARRHAAKRRLAGKPPAPTQ